MRISDWSSDVCSSDLIQPQRDFDVGQRFVAAAEIEQGIAAVAVAGRILGLELDHLPIVGERALGLTEFQEGVAAAEEGPVVEGIELDRLVEIRDGLGEAPHLRKAVGAVEEIGSASCRERGGQYV